jgi:hypothetical protein
MVFYLNKGLILEQIIVQDLKEYFALVGVPEYYGNVTVNITNKHPFARLLINDIQGKAPDTSLFPAIVVATEDDGKPAELMELTSANGIALTPEDVTPPAEGGESPLEARGYMLLTREKLDALRAAITEKGRVYGVSCFIRRRDRIAIEIWAENIQLKNELYELVRLFVCGWMRESLEKRLEESGLTIFDHSVRGQRSNNFNVDFSVDLSGALITFEADYIVEQTVVDTELKSERIDIMEVLNHAKGEIGTSRSTVFDYSAGGGADGGGIAG